MQTQTTSTQQEILMSPFGQTAMLKQEECIREAIKSLGFIPATEKQLHILFNATPFTTLNEKEAQLSSVLGMVQTMILEDRIAELFEVFKSAYPEYYYSDEQIEAQPA